MKYLTAEYEEQLVNRFTYHPPKHDQIERYAQIRDKAKELALIIGDACPPSPERSTAITQLVAVVMTANSAIANNE